MLKCSGKLVVQAPAKVNITLHILAKRPDGYHELDSVMQKLDLCDTLHLQSLDIPGITLRCPNSDLPEDESNIVVQAAASFFKESGLGDNCGVSMVLNKRIPVAAGLGGGSSDAGAVLTGLNRLFNAEVSEERLLSLAKQLGADVPFFVLSSSAVRARGIGERMNVVDSLKKCSVLLVNPGFLVSTSWVYKNFTLTGTDKDSILSSFCANDALERGYPSLYNDLESVTIARYPELQTIKDTMVENGAVEALMSGSGPTVFGVFPDSSDCDVQRCADTMREKYGAGVFVTRPFVVESLY